MQFDEAGNQEIAFQVDPVPRGAVVDGLDHRALDPHAPPHDAVRHHDLRIAENGLFSAHGTSSILNER